ncbi:MAG: hypothetical protein M3Q10_03295 [Chloroflexota bacterium]|nr:hypothetical protein [Chloroflexota bacterium]
MHPPATRLPLVALLAANAISLLGNHLTALAIPWFGLETTGSAARTGPVAFAAPLGVLVAGGLIEAVGVRPLLLATGAILVAAALPIAVLATFQGLDRAESKAEADATRGRS